MSRLTRLVRENKRIADDLVAEASKPIPRVVKKRKPVRCTRNLNGKDGVQLTAKVVAEFLALVPEGAEINPTMTYSPSASELLSYSYRMRPDVLSGLEAVWYEDDRA